MLSNRIPGTSPANIDILQLHSLFFGQFFISGCVSFILLLIHLVFVIIYSSIVPFRKGKQIIQIVHAKKLNKTSCHSPLTACKSIALMKNYHCCSHHKCPLLAGCSPYMSLATMCPQKLTYFLTGIPLPVCTGKGKPTPTCIFWQELAVMAKFQQAIFKNILINKNKMQATE